MKWWLLAAIVGSVGVRLRRFQQARQRQQIAREIADLIKPPVQTYDGHNDALRILTKARRDAADRMRARAAKVESGSKTSDILRMVK